MMKKKVLVAPLFWGLGHATRCIPVINELIRQGAEVVIASDGEALILLKQEYPEFAFIELPSYAIRYSNSNNMFLNIFFQLPSIIKAIIKEHRALKKIIATHGINRVISDNRFGLFNKSVKTVFITHQLFIIPPIGFGWLKQVIQKINFSLIQRFDSCWVPDIEAENNLSGKLSHGHIKFLNAIFIGPLSRFTKAEGQPEKKYKYDLLIILSGPEPQRTVFENIITKQITSQTGTVLLVRGISIDKEGKQVNGNLTRVNHLPASSMYEAILVSKLILCRSGYSSIMDLAALGKKAVFIPTPGQTEQEYLASYFLSRNIFYSKQQDSFYLQEAIIASKHFTGIKLEIQKELEMAVSDFLI